MKQKGTQEMLANLTKVMIYKGKLHTAPHLSRWRLILNISSACCPNGSQEASGGSFFAFWVLLPKWPLRTLWRLSLNISGPKGTRETAWWRAGYERNSGMSYRVAKKYGNLRAKLWNGPKNAVNYERNSLRQKGTQYLLTISQRL